MYLSDGRLSYSSVLANGPSTALLGGKHTKQDQLELRESVAHASGTGGTTRSHDGGVAVVLRVSKAVKEDADSRKLEPSLGLGRNSASEMRYSPLEISRLTVEDVRGRQRKQSLLGCGSE